MQTPCLATFCLLAMLGPAVMAAEPPKMEPAAAQPAAAEPLITLDLKDRDRESGVEVLSTQSGRSFVLGEGVGRIVSTAGVALTEVPMSTAIETIAILYRVCSVARPGITSFQSCDNGDALGKVVLGVSLVTMT